MSSTMKLLLTGFEPFGESKVNPSEQVVRSLARQGIDGVDIYTVILPVQRTRGPETLVRAVQGTQPDAVLCLGEASRRMAISIERVAINLMDYRIPDNAGEQVVDVPVVPGGPAGYFCTLPVRAMLKAVGAAGIPAELSLSAGSFLCNQVIYTLLHHLASHHLETRAGFVHLPRLPEQVANQHPVAPSMSLETMSEGIRAAIGAIQAQPA